MGESPSTLAATLSVIAGGGKTFGSRSFSLPFAQGREERWKTRKILSPWVAAGRVTCRTIRYRGGFRFGQLSNKLHFQGRCKILGKACNLLASRKDDLMHRKTALCACCVVEKDNLSPLKWEMKKLLFIFAQSGGNGTKSLCLYSLPWKNIWNCTVAHWAVHWT